jgi:hypothetical protein
MLNSCDHWLDRRRFQQTCSSPIPDNNLANRGQGSRPASHGHNYIVRPLAMIVCVRNNDCRTPFAGRLIRERKGHKDKVAKLTTDHIRRRPDCPKPPEGPVPKAVTLRPLAVSLLHERAKNQRSLRLLQPDREEGFEFSRLTGALGLGSFFQLFIIGRIVHFTAPAVPVALRVEPSGCSQWRRGSRRRRRRARFP